MDSLRTSFEHAQTALANNSNMVHCVLPNIQKFRKEDADAYSTRRQVKKLQAEVTDTQRQLASKEIHISAQLQMHQATVQALEHRLDCISKHLRTSLKLMTDCGTLQQDSLHKLQQQVSLLEENVTAAKQISNGAQATSCSGSPPAPDPSTPDRAPPSGLQAMAPECYYVTSPSSVTAAVLTKANFTRTSCYSTDDMPIGMLLRADQFCKAPLIIASMPQEDVHVILVTYTHELSDLSGLGCGPLYIVKHKFQQYCAARQMEPAQVLSCVIDIGVADARLLQDPAYTYMKQGTLPDAKAEAMLVNVRCAVRSRWPECQLTFEGFQSQPSSLLSIRPQSGPHHTPSPVQASSSAQSTATGQHASGLDRLQPPSVQWSDVAGLDAAKQALREATLLPVHYPHFFTGRRKPWSSILLYGPPGTGKSLLAKAVAGETKAAFFAMSSADLTSKWLGESEKLVRQLFEQARRAAPSLSFIDEIDSICRKRSDSEHAADRRQKTELLLQMDHARNSSAQVVVLAATNLPYDLDPAVCRRFDKRIHIPLPDAAARSGMLKSALTDTNNQLDSASLQQLVTQTEGFSGSDVAVLVKDILMEAVRITQQATTVRIVQKHGEQSLEACSPDEAGAMETDLNCLAQSGEAAKVVLPPVTASMLSALVEKAHASADTSMMQMYQRLTLEYGENG